MSTENITILLSAAALAAVLPHAAKSDRRFYLNGVFIESTVDATRCIATNGHTLAAAINRRPLGMDRSELAGAICETVLIPRETVEQLVKITRGRGDVRMVRKDGAWSITTADLGLAFIPIDGKFPDWRMVVPHYTDSPQVAQVDPELLVLFAKSAKALGVKPHCVHVDHNGESGSRVTLDGCDNFLGVIMPVRQNNRVPALVGDITLRPDEVLAKAA